MVLVDRRWLVALAVLSCCSVLLLGAGAYAIVSGAWRASGAGPRYLAENLLFLSIILAVVVLSLSVGLILRSRSVSRALDRIIDLSRYGAQPVEESLRKIGTLGEKIRELTLALGDLSEKRLLRISSLNEVAAFMTNNSALAAAVTDATGRVYLASPAFLQRVKADREAVRGAAIGELLEGLDFPEVFSRLERERTAVKWDGGKTECRFFPIFNRRGDLSDVACVLGLHEVLTEPKLRDRETPTTARLSRLVRRYFATRQEKRENHSR